MDSSIFQGFRRTHRAA